VTKTWDYLVLNGMKSECKAEQLLHNDRRDLINKTRYTRIQVTSAGWTGFYDDNDGLIMAGIELSSEDEAFDKPDDWDY
jgi:CYTH domain-containing protein